MVIMQRKGGAKILDSLLYKIYFYSILKLRYHKKIKHEIGWIDKENTGPYWNSKGKKDNWNIYTFFMK